MEGVPHLGRAEAGSGLMLAGERHITSDGVELAVREAGDTDRPTVVLIHGYPDTSALWAPVVERLESWYHVATYDVRGAGASSTPRGPNAYSLEHLVADLGVVIDAVSPGNPVHLVGHDWGSIQGWEAVTTSRLRGRIKSFTSISGPSVDHAGNWLRAKLRAGRIGQLLRQVASSWYIAAFDIPGAGRLLSRLAPRRGLDPRTVRNGVGMYRASMRSRLLDPQERRTSLPVQVIIPTRDPFVSPALLDGIEKIAPNLWRRRVRAGHWVQKSHPDLVARWISEFVDHIEGAPATRSLERAHVGAKRKPLEGSLVVITGAGSGIGRATALAFAERGASVIAADINAVAAERTAGLARLLGTDASAFEVDVSDQHSMERFAKAVETEHGVPDVVVNNAGIGIAGPFLSHGFDDWRRVLDVNLWGVIHGSKLFAQQMVDRGEGGHIVNVASAAAFFPSRTLPAYSTTKAAVLMLSECLRAELADKGIGVSAICPGLINTSITRTSSFVGLAREEQEKKRREAIRIYQIRNFTPDRVATEIVRAVRENVAVVPVAPEAKALRVLSRLSPRVMRVLARLEAPL
jgi:NAD(P)-dependent dehydrogenase (short-subunit alcohol dehydrogenase family)/pimeloyl-ACP methyl ester carboxylesterase